MFFFSSDAEACTAMILKYVHSLFQQIQLHDWIISVKAVNVLLQVEQIHRYIDFLFLLNFCSLADLLKKERKFTIMKEKGQ